MEFVTEPIATESENSVGAADGPKHARLFQPRSDDSFTASLDDTGTDEQMIGTELGVAHTLRVAGEVFGLGGQGLGQIVGRGHEGA